MNQPAHILPDGQARLAARRDRVERILDAARALPPADRALLEEILGRGTTATQLARAARLPRWRVVRRLRRIMRRTRHPLFEAASFHFDSLPARIRPTVRLALFHGLSLRSVARRRKLSLHQVRKQLDQARSLIAPTCRSSDSITSD